MRSLLAAQDLPAISAAVSHAARQVVDADGASVVLLDGASCYCIDEEAIGPLWKGRRFPAKDCVSGLAMQSQRPVAIPDVMLDDRVPHDLYRQTFVTGLLLVPSGEPAIGAIGAYWATPHEASDWEIDALSQLADAMAVAVNNLRTQARLAESERRFRTMADTTPLMIWVHDGSGKLEFVNRAWLSFFGATEEEARGDNWQPLLHPDDRHAYVSHFLDCLARGVPYEAETRVRRADGEWRWIGSYGAPRLDDTGACVGMVGSSADITNLKATAFRADDESRRKEQWLSVVGHELRQPVHAIQGALRMLQPDTPASAHQRALAVLDRQTKHMSRILDDLLDTARIVRGEVELEQQVVDLREVLAEAVDTAASDYERRHQRVTVHVPSAPVLVRVDVQRLLQVLGNLLSNASKYSNLGDRVATAITVLGTEAELSVSDVGRGIDPAVLPRVFDLFTSVGGDRGSYGVGLAVARRLVELHGGTLQGYSDGLGLGSRFVVRLRVVADAELV